MTSNKITEEELFKLDSITLLVKARGMGLNVSGNDSRGVIVDAILAALCR